MRSKILVAAFALTFVSASAKTKPSARIAALPDGELAGHIYINKALSLTFEYPADWIASTDPKRTIDLDPERPDGSAVQCSRVLLSLKAPSQGEGRFSGVAYLIAIDPGCLTIVPFPGSPFDRRDIDDMIDVLIKNFKHSPFFSPYGVKYQVSDERGHIEFLLTGGMTINAIESHLGQSAAAKEPLDVHTSFFVVESNGFWIARGYVADGASEQELNQSKLSLPGIPPPSWLKLVPPLGNPPAKP